MKIRSRSTMPSSFQVATSTTSKPSRVPPATRVSGQRSQASSASTRAMEANWPGKENSCRTSTTPKRATRKTRSSGTTRTRGMHRLSIETYRMSTAPAAAWLLDVAGYEIRTVGPDDLDLVGRFFALRRATARCSCTAFCSTPGSSRPAGSAAATGGASRSSRTAPTRPCGCACVVVRAPTSPVPGCADAGPGAGGPAREGAPGDGGVAAGRPGPASRPPDPCTSGARASSPARASTGSAHRWTVASSSAWTSPARRDHHGPTAASADRRPPWTRADLADRLGPGRAGTPVGPFPRRRVPGPAARRHRRMGGPRGIEPTTRGLKVRCSAS